MAFLRRALFGAVAALGLLAAGCTDSGEPGGAPAENAAQPQLPQGHPPITGQQAPAAGGFAGTVLETVTAGGYTYARVETAQGELWAAGPVTSLAEGESVTLVDPMNMGTFTSKALDRTFDELYFVGAFRKGDPAGEAATEAPATIAQAPVSQTMNAGGYTYAEVQTESGPVWLAGPEAEIAEGDVLTWKGGMVMRDFASPSLNRTFDQIIFVEALSVVR